MKRFVLCAGCAVLATISNAQENVLACEDPPFEAIESSVVTVIFRYLEPDEKGFTGRRGNGVFLSPTKIATPGHLTENMFEEAGGEVILGWSSGNGSRVDEDNLLPLPIVGISQIDTGLSDSLTIIELEAGALTRTEVGVRYAPITEGDPVFSIFYDKLVLHHADGWYRVPQYNRDAKAEGEIHEPFLQFQLVPADDAYEFEVSKGMSGGPIFDCDGDLVSITSGILTYQAQPFAGFELPANMRNPDLLPPSISRVVRWWQTKPNVAGIPVSMYVPE